MSKAHSPEPKAQHTEVSQNPPARNTANLHWLNKTYDRNGLIYQSLGTTAIDGELVQSESVAWIHDGLDAALDAHLRHEIPLDYDSEDALLNNFGDENGVHDGVLAEPSDTINYDGLVQYSLLNHTLGVAFRALTNQRNYTPSADRYHLYDVGVYGFILEDKQTENDVIIAPAVSKADA